MFLGTKVGEANCNLIALLTLMRLWASSCSIAATFTARAAALSMALRYWAAEENQSPMSSIVSFSPPSPSSPSPSPSSSSSAASVEFNQQTCVVALLMERRGKGGEGGGGGGGNAYAINE